MRAPLAAAFLVALVPSLARADDSILSKAGDVIGKIVAPVFAEGARLRGARFFHPSGLTYTGSVRSVATDPAFAPVAKKLEGAALARLGGGLLKFKVGDKESSLPDVPGIAIRFEQPSPVATPDSHPGDLDLTFCAYTERFRTLVTGISFLEADSGDFLDNDYFPDVPFHMDGVGDVWLRLRAHRVPTRGSFRAERFNNAVHDGKAVFTLEAQRANSSFTREWLGMDLGKLLTTLDVGAARKANPWIPLVEIRFSERVDVDQGKLAFDPESTARGLQPKGIVTAIRGPVYRRERKARPQSEPPVQILDANAPRTVGLGGALERGVAKPER